MGWEEITGDTEAGLGIGTVGVFHPKIRTLRKRVVDKSKLQVVARLYRSWIREYTTLEFVVDIGRSALPMANVTILQKEASFYGVYEQRLEATIGQQLSTNTR